jgi:monoamine oxidase
MNDIIIIGGGIAGLYCFHQLQKKFSEENKNNQNQTYKISLFEKNDYFGGRCLTTYKKFKKIKIEKISNKIIQYEKGAGRLNKNHKLFLSLIQELDLEQDLIEITGNTEILPSKKYDLKPIFKNKSSFTYIKKVIKQAKLFIKNKKNIQKLQKYTFIDYAKTILNSEQINFLLDFSGYYGELVYENAYDAIRLFEEGISNSLKYYVLKHGFSSVIDKLVCKINQTSKIHNQVHNQKLFLNQELLKIKELGNTYVLNINNNIYQTKYLILALPKPALLKFNYLNIYNPELNSVSCKPLCRIYSIFPKPWFQNLEKSTTNIKLRYIIPINKQTGLVMISYTDSKYALYWKKFLNKSNKELNKELLKQLSLLYSTEEMKKLNIKAPIYNSINYWNCGVGYWKPKVNSTTMSQKMLKLNKNRNLYIIGENYSKNQGWVEGALESVHELFKKYFD